MSNISFSSWLPIAFTPHVSMKVRVLALNILLWGKFFKNWISFSRIFRQPQGHLLLIGVSGAGKTTLSRFVAWMNGLSVYQIKVGTMLFKAIWAHVVTDGIMC